MLQFFDAYTCIGPRRAKHPAHGWRLSDVQQDMRQCSIAGALVAHQLGINYDPMWANLKLAEILGENALRIIEKCRSAATPG